MTLLRAVLSALALILLGAIVWASLSLPIGESFARIVADPWGVVTLLDLYFGFLLFSVFVILFEPNRLLAGAVVLLTLVLGNLVTAAWLVLRLGRIVAARRAEAQASIKP